MAAELRVTELGEEKRCKRCLDWWPNDDEFFSRRDRRDYCRACAQEVPQMTDEQRRRANAKRQAERLDPVRGDEVRARARAAYARRKTRAA